MYYVMYNLTFISVNEFFHAILHFLFWKILFLFNIYTFNFELQIKVWYCRTVPQNYSSDQKVIGKAKIFIFS